MAQISHNISKHPLKKIRVQSALVLNRIRRALAKAIEPKRPEPNLKWDFPIKTSIRGTQALRKKLAITEEDFLFVSGPSFADSRAYVLYTALDEVIKTAMYLMRLQELMEGPQISPREDMMSRLTVSHIIEEVHARERRLLEVLITLIMFSTTNEQQYYRYLLLLEDLDDLLAANTDLEDFYGARSSNIDFSIDLTIKEIRRIEETLDHSKAWFRSQDIKSPLPDRNKLRPRRILTSFRGKLKMALPFMSDNEKILFGLSYAGYGEKSESIHYHTNQRDLIPDQGQEERGVDVLGLLNFAILVRCFELMGEPDVPIVRKLSDSHKRTVSNEFIDKITKHDISIGDFVLAYGDLAEVQEVRKSPYGYQSYKVRYLAEKPLKEIQEDWFPALYVKLFYTRSQFIERLRLMSSQGKIPPIIADKIEKFSNQEIQEIIRASLVETWKLGLRDWVRGQQSKSTDKK